MKLLLLLLALAPSAVAPAATGCTTGLTVSHAPGLSYDYLADTFSASGAEGFVYGDKNQALRIAASYLGVPQFCNISSGACDWAIYSYPNQSSLVAELHARCTDCPRVGSGAWQRAPAFPQTWQLRQGGAWVPAPRMRASCCTFKPTKCDNCTDAYCTATYKTFGACLKATLSTCCQAGGWIDQGKCLCKQPVRSCEHNASGT